MLDVSPDQCQRYIFVHRAFIQRQFEGQADRRFLSTNIYRFLCTELHQHITTTTIHAQDTHGKHRGPSVSWEDRQRPVAPFMTSILKVHMMTSWIMAEEV